MTARRSGITLGLVGRKRSGKDTFAAALVEERGFRRVAFADALRAVALGADPYVRIEADEFGPVGFTGGAAFPQQTHYRLSTLVEFVGWERAKAARDVRRFLQRLGSEGVRSIDPNFWLRAAFADVEPDEDVVVTDVRFPNEADLIEAFGGALVRIVRPGLPNDGDQHASEIALDDRLVDYVVENTGTVDDLRGLALRVADDEAVLDEVRPLYG